jgi:hypothetical protein
MQGIQVWESVLFIISIFPMKQNATVIPDTYFNDHFKLRSSSYNKTDLEHFGEWVAPERTSLGKATAGNERKHSVTNIGVQLSIS